MVTTKATGKSLADFRAVHDKSFVVPNKIKAGLEKLGNDGWEYEADFIKLCGLNINDFGRFRDQFGDNIVAFKQDGRDRRIIAGSKALAAKMREML